MTNDNKQQKIFGNTETDIVGYTLLPAIFCRRISNGKYFIKIGEHEYEIYNYGYYAPDKCIWWEAVNLKTNEADFHETTKSQLIKTMQHELS